MYHIRPESILTFLEDHSIRFPRFQRKQTWKNDQNFKLVISIFKNFPIGVTIINKQTLGGKSTRWLLDGRQRRYALEKMYQDPENIYLWARKFLGIKSSDQPQEIRDKFWSKLEVYLNDADEAGFNQTREESIRKGENEFYFDGKIYSINSIQDEADDFDGDFSEDDLIENVTDKTGEQLISEYSRSVWGNLDELLFIIKTTHNKTSSKSGFTSPFDFRKNIKNLTYSIDGNKNLCGQRLKTFIGEFSQHCLDNQIQETDPKSLSGFYNSRYQLSQKDLNNVTNLIKQNWDDIKNSIMVVSIIKNRLHEAIIGIIETQDITATDSQMIFTLINKEGTKLSAVEILSAKPAWNIPVKSPSKDVEEQREKLYNAIKTEVVNTVRWDYPATTYERVSNLNFLFPKLDYNINNQLDKKLTLGFKILSGLYQNGIKKEDVDKLSTNRDIKWESDIDKLIDDINLMGKVLADSNYFKYLYGLGRTFMDITSDAIALNFLFTCFHDFKRKGNPVGTSATAKIFTHNAIILADKLVFEYATFKWRGSSDSKISKNILAFSGLPDKYQPIEDKAWIGLFKSINDTYCIDDTDISLGISKSLVYHVYSMMSFTCPDGSSIDVDHIIPQTLFDSSSISKATSIKNSLFNLCPLPSKDNIKKSNKRLNQIDDQWLKDQIKYFAKIKESEFDIYSDIQNWEKLRINRRSIFETEFIENRKSKFNN